MQNMRARLNGSGKRYGTSLTLPSSYWYMQHFDIVGLEPHVDWFNVMTYDIRKWKLDHLNSKIIANQSDNLQMELGTGTSPHLVRKPKPTRI